MLVSLVLNYYIQVQMKYRDMSEGARKTFLQVRRIIDENKKESERIKVDFAQNCLIRAKAAAYCVQYHPEMLEDQMEMKKVASILQIDEFHIFDKEGNLYAGSEPKYFGMNFNSGEQMQFFLPMLKDTTLELCQDITPNTAEAKMMQYAAVWREDKKEIIQIGMEPARVLEAMEKTRLSYIFSLVAVDSGADIYAISEENGKVSGSTSGMQVGMDARELGFDLDKAVKNEKVYSMVIGGQRKCCVFENKDSLILVKTFDRGSIFEGINKNIGLLVLYLVLMICFILYFIVRYLDKYIIQSVYGINEKLQAITEGDLMIELGSQPTPELTKLSTHVNDMVKSILSTTNKLSIVLDTVKLPLGVYEYAPGMKPGDGDQPDA